MMIFAKGITPGTKVTQGQVIGWVGSTGESTGSHLHYELIVNGTKVDATSVKQTERFVVVLKVTEDKAQAADLLLVDYLPAGFEIDNPNLLTQGDLDVSTGWR